MRDRLRIGAAERKRDSEGGFTLLEMMIVIVLVGLLAAFALPNISNIFRLSLNTTTREIASLVREAYNSAVITKRVHRLAYDVDNGEYWVEAGPPGALLESEKSLELARQRSRLGGEASTAPVGFQIANEITRKKRELPTGVTFEDVISEESKDPVVEGVAYTHFFPHGLTERTIIHLQDNQDHQISLVISALGGKTKLLNEYVREEDVFGR